MNDLINNHYRCNQIIAAKKIGDVIFPQRPVFMTQIRGKRILVFTAGVDCPVFASGGGV